MAGKSQSDQKNNERAATDLQIPLNDYKTESRRKNWKNLITQLGNIL